MASRSRIFLRTIRSASATVSASGDLRNESILTVDQEFLKLGLQGVSIFVASGDTGVGGIPGDGAANGCVSLMTHSPTRLRSLTLDLQLRNGTVFSPTQPNSCPWLTNVGATKVYPGKTVFEPESAVVDPAGHPYRGAFSSGGGFSNIFGIPGKVEGHDSCLRRDY